jgi:predicted dinucleotide-binding enzyme
MKIGIIGAGNIGGTLQRITNFFADFYSALLGGATVRKSSIRACPR